MVLVADRAFPVALQVLTCLAKRREHRVSSGEIGFKFTIMRILAVSLDSCFSRQKVSLELR